MSKITIRNLRANDISSHATRAAEAIDERDESFRVVIYWSEQTDHVWSRLGRIRMEDRDGNGYDIGHVTPSGTSHVTYTVDIDQPHRRSDMPGWMAFVQRLVF